MINRSNRLEIEQARIRKRLAEDPWPRAEIIAVHPQDGRPNDPTVLVRFDVTHPHSPDQSGEMTIPGGVFQFYGEDEVLQSRRLREPKVGMTRILRSVPDLRDGITLHWQFVIDLDTGNRT